ncbi:conserved repeat domain protein [Psychroflexus torquis ATCC 700755]|uniref:Conserved repeat domain protein n=1 Tax=Psychroflexus torquis (strain ATCC 700755 / CIP 106069 / ACAM 623) TaxID=313595 RepID=K4IDI2_PSYTT|nr:gliding motility-associated C-terminal domain-containing protein [Psychroflexus torquis]AFU67171.1 conserved repeat domain protein [Psychroflexus torquis ATCC 700755]
MKIKLLNSFFIRCSFIVGLAILSLIPKEESSAQETKLIAGVKIDNLNNFKSSKSVTSFFKNFINQALNPPSTSELNIDNILGHVGYNSDRQSGTKTFLRCTNHLNNNGNFEFFNPDIPVTPQFIDQGDSITCTQVEDHIYISEIHTLINSITFPDITSNNNKFKVFVREFTSRILTSATSINLAYTFKWLKDKVVIATTQNQENIDAGYSIIVATDKNTDIDGFNTNEQKPIEIRVVEKTAVVCNSKIEILGAFSPQNLSDDFNGFINIDILGGNLLETDSNGLAYQYEWKNEVDDVISTEKNLTDVGPGLYKINIYDNSVWIASKDVELVMPDPIDITINSKDETCVFKEDGTITLDITGGTEPYNIVWDTGDTGAILNNLQPGTYKAIIIDKYNCNEEVSVKIEGANVLEIDHYTESISCFNTADGFIDVNVNGGRQFTDGSYEYQWTGPDGFTSTQASISNLSIEGTYKLVVTDASNCTEFLDVFINKPAPLKVSFQTTQVNCFGIDDGTITLFVNGGTPPYTSNFGPGNKTFLFENLEPGIYDIDVMDDNGCIELLEIEIEPDYINQINPPQGEPFQEFCIEDQPMLSDLNVKGTGIKWYFSPSSYDALPNDHLIEESAILYARNFDESLKCLSSQTLRVEIRIIEGILKVNNFITINGNNLNEKLNVINMELFPENEMKIYNRYGKLVWETTNYENINNTFKGMSNVGGKISQSNFLPKGTYFYILNYKSPCNKNTKKGFIQVENNNG